MASLALALVSALPRCRTPELAGLEITRELVHAHAQAGVLIVTFTNQGGAAMALNWARQLHSLGGLRSLIGLTGPLSEATLAALRRVGAGIFCADGQLARLDSAAGRWEELAPLVDFGLDVLCSDADIAWLRNPLPYLRAVQRRHPTVDIALAADRVTLDFTSAPLGRRYFRGRELAPPEAAARSAAASSAEKRMAATSASHRRAASAASAQELAAQALDLGLEDAPTFQTPSYNVGIVMLYSGGGRASSAQPAAMGAMLRAWTTACITSAPGAHKVKLDGWAQGPINTKVLRPGLTRDPADTLLARIYSGRLALGVLPSLQFTTALTYFAFEPRRRELRLDMFCVHAIFSHGRDGMRKVSILRQASSSEERCDESAVAKRDAMSQR